MTLTDQAARRFDALRTIALTTGSHEPTEALEGGACAMELAAYVAGEDWSDRPQCVDGVIAAAVRAANDRGPQWVRDALRDRIPAMIGTADSPATARARAEIFAWCAIKEIAPYYLDRAGLKDHAKALREFEGTLSAARDVARRARSAADAAYAADAAAAYAADAAAAYAAYAADAAAAYAADAAAAYAADAADAADARPAWEMFLAALDRAIGWLP